MALEPAKWLHTLVQPTCVLYTVPLSQSPTERLLLMQAPLDGIPALDGPVDEQLHL